MDLQNKWKNNAFRKLELDENRFCKFYLISSHLFSLIFTDFPMEQFSPWTFCSFLEYCRLLKLTYSHGDWCYLASVICT